MLYLEFPLPSAVLDVSFPDSYALSSGLDGIGAAIDTMVNWDGTVIQPDYPPPTKFGYGVIQPDFPPPTK